MGFRFDRGRHVKPLVGPVKSQPIYGANLANTDVDGVVLRIVVGVDVAGITTPGSSERHDGVGIRVKGGGQAGETGGNVLQIFVFTKVEVHRTNVQITGAGGHEANVTILKSAGRVSISSCSKATSRGKEFYPVVFAGVQPGNVVTPVRPRDR